MKCEIQEYFHCKNCGKDRPTEFSPQQWSRIDVGWTIQGLEVWCFRCNKKIIHLDFLKQKMDSI